MKRSLFIVLPLIALLSCWGHAGIEIYADFNVAALEGESQDEDHEKWIDVLAVSTGFQNQIVSLSSDKTRVATANHISFTKYLDRSTPGFFEYLARGTLIEAGRFEFVGAFADPVLIIELEELYVSGINTGGDNHEDRLEETVTLASNIYKLTVNEFGEDAEKEGVHVAHWDFARNVKPDGPPISNTPPTITSIGNFTMSEDASITKSFVVNDAETANGALVLTRSSTNPVLLPPSQITFGGSGSNRTVTFTPEANQFGSTLVTVRVSDGSLSATTTFTVTVQPVNDKPVLNPIAAQAVDAGGTLELDLGFTDVDTTLGDITLRATSDDQTLLPNANISLSGSGAVRSISLTPAPGQFGSVFVSLTANDGTVDSDAISFLLVVNESAGSAPNDILLTANSVPENAGSLTEIGMLSAVDSDVDDTATFELLNNAAGRFQLGGEGGVRLLVASDASLNFEETASHDILVRATDSKGNQFSKTLTLEVQNVNEAPVILSAPQDGIIPFEDYSITDLVIEDVDAGDGIIFIFLSVDSGSLTIDDGDVLAESVSGNGTNSLSIGATLSEINSVLGQGGLVYTTFLGESGLDELAIRVNDNGNSGSGEAIETSHLVSLNVSSAYLEWLASYFDESQLADESISGADADFDGDTMSTLVEYALGLDPKDGTDGIGAVEYFEYFDEESERSYPALRFERLSFFDDLALQVTVQIATDDLLWDESGEFVVVQSQLQLESGMEEVVFRTTIPLETPSEPTRQFLRIQAKLGEIVTF